MLQIWICFDEYRSFASKIKVRVCSGTKTKRRCHSGTIPFWTGRSASKSSQRISRSMHNASARLYSHFEIARNLSWRRCRPHCRRWRSIRICNWLLSINTWIIRKNAIFSIRKRLLASDRLSRRLTDWVSDVADEVAQLMIDAQLDDSCLFGRRSLPCQIRLCFESGAASTRSVARKRWPVRATSTRPHDVMHEMQNAVNLTNYQTCSEF